MLLDIDNAQDSPQPIIQPPVSPGPRLSHSALACGLIGVYLLYLICIFSALGKDPIDQEVSNNRFLLVNK